MTVCEIVTHRIFVGLQHSRHLLRRPTLWQHWLEVLDGLGGFVDLVPGRGPGQHTSGPGEEQVVHQHQQQQQQQQQQQLEPWCCSGQIQACVPASGFFGASRCC
jgi:hypothetical protein